MEESPFEPEDYSFTADLLRQHSRDDKPKLFQAVCSNNLNIILSALDHAAAAPDLLRALRGAHHALISYQHGNASTELAEEVAEWCAAAIAKATGEAG